MLYYVTVNLNRSEGNFLYGYRPGDQLEAVGTYTIEADDIHAAAEVIFEFGNLRNTQDLEGNSYPVNQRSISKGDVLTILSDNGTETLACASFGWDSIDGSIKAANRV